MCDSTVDSIDLNLAERSSSGWAGVSREAAAGPDAALYLEQSRKLVTTRTLAVSCGCKSWFCPRCCMPMGIKLKRELKAVLRTFRSVMMLTFTLDQQHFVDAPAAMAFVRANHCIGVTMQALRRAGVLLSNRWFAVIEWQANGWPHWHVLVEADFIPFETLAAAWNVHLKKLGKRPDNQRVGFGSVRFSKTDFKIPEVAAGYACAYLTKYPKQGFPEWVLTSRVRLVHRYSVSRGFWPAKAETPEPEPSEDAPEEVSDSLDEDEVPDVYAPPERTITQQLAECGGRTVILRELEYLDEASGELSVVHRFMRRIEMPMVDFLATLTADTFRLNRTGTRAEFHYSPP